MEEPINSPSPLPDDPSTTHHSDWLPLVLVATLLFTLVLLTLSRFGNLKSQPWYVTMACTVGWFFPFWIVFLLPLDLASVSLYLVENESKFFFDLVYSLYTTTKEVECLLLMFLSLFFLLLGELFIGLLFV